MNSTASAWNCGFNIILLSYYAKKSYLLFLCKTGFVVESCSLADLMVLEILYLHFPWILPWCGASFSPPADTLIPFHPGFRSPLLLPVWMNASFLTFIKDVIKDECSLVVRLPYSLISCQFWLFFVFKFVVVLLLVVGGGTVYLPMPPSWPESDPYFLIDLLGHSEFLISVFLSLFLSLSTYFLLYFSINILSLYITLPSAITTVLFISMSPFSFLLNTSTPLLSSCSPSMSLSSFSLLVRFVH